VKLLNIQRIFWILTSLLLVSGAFVCAFGQDGGSGYSFGDSADKNAACLSCHGNAQKVAATSLIDTRQFTHTTHAQIGCASCHGVNPKHPDGIKTPRANCGECHLEVNQEYAGSIHASKTDCAGCHNPHKVKTLTEISGPEMNRMCSGCHEAFEMVSKHGLWLPQADLHIRMLPCITCHTGSKSYFINMYIVRGKDGSRFGKPEVAGYDELKGIASGGSILSLIDSNGDKYVSLTELRNFNTNPDHKQLRLQGMMTPETVTHKFEILDSRRNCTFCHASGPAAMQTSFIALPESDGTFTRVAVEKGAVLDALYGTPDFYMMGSTKNETLNYLGLAIICGGLVLPVGHGSIRFLTRKNRKGKEHQS